MHRLDCVSDDDNRSAIGVCTTRGAAVCESCARIGHQAIRNLTGLAGGQLAHGDPQGRVRAVREGTRRPAWWPLPLRGVGGHVLDNR